ncbi:MAG: hypothetical protein ACPLUI_07040 [Desulfofundulus sp.]
MKRPRGFMDWETFVHTVSYLKQEPPPGGVVGLHHFGESLLHPQLPAFLEYLKQNNINWRLSTNGRLLKRADIRTMLLTYPGLLVISMENGADPEDVNTLILEKKAQGAPLQILVQTFGDADLRRLVSGDYEIFRVKRHSWAKSGQGDYLKCCFLNQDWVCVLWDGTIVSCCMDMEGEARLGHVTGKRNRNYPWRACRTCEVVMQCL